MAAEGTFARNLPRRTAVGTTAVWNGIKSYFDIGRLKNRWPVTDARLPQYATADAKRFRTEVASRLVQLRTLDTAATSVAACAAYFYGSGLNPYPPAVTRTKVA